MNDHSDKKLDMVLENNERTVEGADDHSKEVHRRVVRQKCKRAGPKLPTTRWENDANYIALVVGRIE